MKTVSDNKALAMQTASNYLFRLSGLERQNNVNLDDEFQTIIAPLSIKAIIELQEVLYRFCKVHEEANSRK